MLGVIKPPNNSNFTELVTDIKRLRVYHGVMHKKLLKFIKKHHIKLLPVMFASVFILSAVFTTYLLNKNKSNTNPKDEVITFSTDKPDEKKPDKNTYKWSGGENDPKYLTMPTIKAEGFIQKVGVDQNKAVAVPNNIHVAGWFTTTETVRFAEKGLSIIDGHVDGQTEVGIFDKLANVKKDDKFEVELGNGKKLSYKVMEVITVPTSEAAAKLFNQDPKVKSQLNLITCGGTFDKKVGQYDKRVIVTAALQ